METKIEEKKERFIHWRHIAFGAICALLALCMTQSSVSQIYTSLRSKKETPVIIVHGMGGSDLYRYPGTERETLLKSAGLGNVFGTLITHRAFAKSIIKMMASSEPEIDRKELMDQLSEYAKSTEMNCDKNGNSDPDVGINNYWTDSLSHHPEYFQKKGAGVVKIASQICKKVGAENVYAYNYDWRLDLYESGQGLADYIDVVRKNTDSDKVILVTDSLGGATVSCYLDAHKKDNVLKRVVFIDCAFDGVDCSAVLSDGINCNKEQEQKYLKRLGNALESGEFEALFLAATSVFGGSLDNLSRNINGNAADPELLKEIYLRVFRPLLGYIPTFWELLPYANYKRAVHNMTKIGFLDPKSELFDKIERYHKVQGRFHSNLKYIESHGVEVAIFANYGFPGIPITPKSSKQTDILIETEYASAGGTVAYTGKKLKKPLGDEKYFSPDMEIDASTCALPDNTWFIKNIHHLGYSVDKEALQFITDIAVGNTGTSIKKVKRKTGLGQFLYADSKQRLRNVKKGD